MEALYKWHCLLTMSIDFNTKLQLFSKLEASNLGPYTVRYVICLMIFLASWFFRHDLKERNWEKPSSIRLGFFSAFDSLASIGTQLCVRKNLFMSRCSNREKPSHAPWLEKEPKRLKSKKIPSIPLLLFLGLWSGCISQPLRERLVLSLSHPHTLALSHSLQNLTHFKCLSVPLCCKNAKFKFHFFVISLLSSMGSHHRQGAVLVPNEKL